MDIHEPLAWEEIARMDGSDMVALRDRVNDPYVAWHPEARTVILALLDHLEHGAVLPETKLAYDAWQGYYNRPARP